MYLLLSKREEIVPTYTIPPPLGVTIPTPSAHDRRDSRVSTAVSQGRAYTQLYHAPPAASKGTVVYEPLRGGGEGLHLLTQSPHIACLAPHSPSRTQGTRVCLPLCRGEGLHPPTPSPCRYVGGRDYIHQHHPPRGVPPLPRSMQARADWGASAVV